MFERIKRVLGIISNMNISTSRNCVVAFILALEQADEDKNGIIKVKEMVKLFKTLFLYPVSKDMSDDEIKAYIESFITRR